MIVAVVRIWPEGSTIMPSTWVRTRIGRPPGKSFDEGEVGEGNVVYWKD